MSTDSVQRPTLGEIVARERQCSLDIAQRRLLFQSMPVWKRPIWQIVEWLNPSSFDHDRDVIREASLAKSIEEVKSSVDMLHYRGRRQARFCRDYLGFRISGRKLMRLAAKYFDRP